MTYATVAMVTDYDCWHPEHDAVEVSDIIAVVRANADKAARLVARLARDFPAEHEPCPAKSDRALDAALITAPAHRDPALMKKLDAVAGRVLRTPDDQRKGAKPEPTRRPASRAPITRRTIATMIAAGIAASAALTKKATSRVNGTSMSVTVTR
jgi:hypothetical protein